MGVFLSNQVFILPCVSLPHARGGVSFLHQNRRATTKSSPRPWGCFLYSISVIFHFLVFPTPVGVFLLFYYDEARYESLPHARGGVSAIVDAIWDEIESSPRPWGCF